ncbi:MAG: hypothetical protein H6506_01830 [Calditrichaeota bacterium]|nr:hypothetical protein [Calditrichota bacterium]MCB9391371.1 hypothetical protein [Calditrichota bacterium]
MKKALLVIVCLVFAATAFAQESEISNDVGYVKLNVSGSGTPGVVSTLSFGLPFKFWVVTGGIPQYGNESTKPSSIVGSQANPGTFGGADRINRVDNGQFGWRNSATGGSWTGTLETSGTGTMIPGRGYQYVNKTGAARTLVLAGDVDNTGDYGTVAIGAPVPPATQAATAVSWRDSRNVDRANLNLLEDGFVGGNFGGSDRVSQTVGGNFAWYNTTTLAWAGTLVSITPGQYYNIVNKHAAAWTYSYDGVDGPAPLTDGIVVPAAVITKAPVSTKSVKTAK